MKGLEPFWYSTDNGPERRGHGGTTPSRLEKMTTYEGGVHAGLPKEVKAPKGAPNVQLILTDDVEPGAPSPRRFKSVRPRLPLGAAPATTPR